MEQYLGDFMLEHTTREVVGANAEHYVFQPGNGTRYEIYVQSVSNFGMGQLGYIDNGYLVVEGLNRTAYLLAAEGYLMRSYVEEFFPQVRESDLNSLTALIAYALNRPTDVTIKDFNI